ncbi:MAG: DUF2341 domain-containing protein [Gammaproteobacteria bacterium]
MKARLLIALSVLLMLPGISHAWWNKDWSFRKKITLDTTAKAANIDKTLSDVPVLVRLHTGNFQYFLDLKQDGSDLRFVAGDDKTPLKYHIEKFDPVNEMALIWVKVPRLIAESNNNSIWMYYGDANAPAAGDAAGTFDTHQTLVYHFDNSKALVRDATAYGNQPSQATVSADPAAIIGSGVSFTGDSLIRIPAAPSLHLTPGQGMSFSAWVKIASPEKDAWLLDMQDGARSLVVGIDGTHPYVRLAGAGEPVETPHSATLATGAWNHLAVTVGDGRLVVYINGKAAASIPVEQLPDMGGPIVVGGSADGGHGLQAQVDELRVSNVVRTAAWVALAARSQGPGAKLASYGSDEQNQGSGGGTTSYFGTILRNVTTDGWVVIGLLSLMAAVSWVVMIGKAFLISRTGRHDREFLKAFQRLGAADPDALDSDEDDSDDDGSPLMAELFGRHDHFQNSGLYRIYHRGIQELHSRVGGTAGAQAVGLSAQAVGTLRAALDAAQVRETQKLNAQMVLLTIAISGGPFLGLLGTVVGVMITFAAIAATGDVNVNAIAPGIAAALVATVAGLAVAIPALFGYNYLASRIREITADMHVFVDEFVNKLAEHYGA